MAVASKKINLQISTDTLLNLQKGDKGSFELLFRHFYRPICIFTARIIDDFHQAEEIVQDVFLTVWNKRTEFSHLKSLESFLYTSSRNAALNILDKEKRLNIRKNGWQDEEPAYELPFSHEMAYAEVLCELHEAISSLPDQCATVMWMLYVEGLSTQDVAKALDLANSTVYNQRSRGIDLLRKRLEPAHFLLFICLIRQKNQLS